MTEKEKMKAGQLYDANNDAVLLQERLKAKQMCRLYNQLPPEAIAERTDILRQLLGRTDASFVIEQPFFCDYGYHIQIGDHFYANMNLTILDENPVIFGNNVFIGPNCAFYTASHPLKADQRKKGLETAQPIFIGNDVWIGGNVIILPGVRVGDGVVIGAGSVVTKDVPAFHLAVGNPCRVIKSLK